jgi:NitT/TauT family transport system substrate-binding protein
MIARALTLAAALVCGAAQAQPLDKVSFATNWVAQAEHGGFYQALVDGTYKKHGLDVTLMPGGPNVNHRLQLIAGRIEFYMSANTLQAFDAVAQNIPTWWWPRSFRRTRRFCWRIPTRASRNSRT